MDHELKALLLQKGLSDDQLDIMQTAAEFPQTLGDLAASASSEEDAREWGKELGLNGRIAVGRFVQAWLEAKAELCSKASSASASGASEMIRRLSQSAEAAEEMQSEEADEMQSEVDEEEGLPESDIAMPTSSAAPLLSEEVSAEKVFVDSLSLTPTSASTPASSSSFSSLASSSSSAASSSKRCSLDLCPIPENEWPALPGAGSEGEEVAQERSTLPTSPSPQKRLVPKLGTSKKYKHPLDFVPSHMGGMSCNAELNATKPKVLPNTAGIKNLRLSDSSASSSSASESISSSSSSELRDGPNPNLTRSSQVSCFLDSTLGGQEMLTRSDKRRNCELTEQESQAIMQGLCGKGLARSPVESRLKEAVLSCPLFQGMPHQVLANIKKKLTLVERTGSPGDKIFWSGQQAQDMYFISSGEVQIHANGQTLATLTAGEVFGEIGVLFDVPRTADAVVSKGPCQLFALSRVDLESLAKTCGCEHQLHTNGQNLQHVKTWFVAQLPLFSKCASEAGFINAVASALKVKEAVPGETIVSQGQDGHEMFFIFAGSVAVSSQRNNLRLSAPNFFGELALLYDEPRSANVSCTTACRFYVLERESLHSIMQGFPRVIGTMYSTAQEASNLKAHFIRKIPLFKSMLQNHEFISNVQLALESLSVAPGDFLVEQGGICNGKMFLIAHGEAQVMIIKEHGQAPQTVSTLKAGSMFGEIALLLDTPRTASVVARGHCHVYTLSRDAFETLAVVYESWWKELMSEHGPLLKQLKQTGIGINANVTTKTHNLQMPVITGTSASRMLSATMPSSPSPQSSHRSQAQLCVVCRTEEKCMLSMPCGHIATCEECHQSVRTCPLCRKNIETSVKAYF